MGARFRGLFLGPLLAVLACSPPSGEPAVRFVITQVDRGDGDGAIDAAQQAELAAPMASSGSITLNGIMLVPDPAKSLGG